MALKYAGIEFAKVWDAEVLGRGLAEYDWLHLHHEDFTGQYSKFYVNYAGAPWLVDMIEQNQADGASLGFPNVPALKRAVAEHIETFVEKGGFLFAMCTATETLDLALASANTDIAASYADGTPMDTDAARKMDWSRALAFQGAQLELCPTTTAFSDIDGHQVNDPVAAPAAGRLHAVQLQRQDRSGGDDAGAEPARRDPRLLRAHHLLPPAHRSSRTSRSWPTRRGRPGSS